ncbi:hypothetical protein B0T14DRAFT_418319 [Immersiella caudata]|uniref:Uncharacterized protein n=1 Tax=Immersiella caudata TaxID=314043 RepID=A0AA40CDR4_9PEZI|nr:hypothetical protein B0T14DRAFT_418319 [Immersiella caudata]
MKLLASTLLALASVVVAQNSCPTATRTVQSRSCRKTCPFTDCNFTTTLRQSCGCPASIPTATLVAPCEAACPYQGCGIEFRTTAIACPTTRRPTPTPTPTPRPPTTTRVVTSLITLPPVRTSTTPCPVITRTTSPDDCPGIRCPIPTCQIRSTLAIPCSCTPKTLLFVQGCQTECSSGCLTRTETVSADRC